MTTDSSASSLRSEGARIARLAAPLALVQLGHATMGLVDVAVVGRHGAVDLAGVGLGNSIFFTIAIFGMGLVLGIEPVISQAIGAGDEQSARRALRTGLWLSALATPPLLVLMGVVLWALPSFGVDPDVVPATRGYVLARAPELPAFLAFMAVKGWLQGHGRTRPIVASVVVANVLNLGLDVLFVFGAGPIPALGAAGAGLATTLCTWVRLAIVAAPATQVAPSSTTSRRDAWRAALSTTELARVLRVGAPLGLTLTLEVAIFAFVAFSMGRLGEADLAAHNVALMLASTPFNLMIGLASATGVVVGHRIGAADPRGAKRAGLVGIALSLACMAASGAAFVAAPAWWSGLFTPDADVIARAAPLVVVAGAFAISDGVQAVASGALRGAGDTTWALVCHLIAHWAIGLPTALWFCFAAGLGAPGLWWGLTCGLTFAAVSLTARFWWRATRGYAAL